MQSLFETITHTTEWEIRYQLLIEAGRLLPPYPDTLKTPHYRVNGCNVPTWLSITQHKNHFIITGYSKSHIVLGLIALMKEYCESKTIDQLTQISVRDFAPLSLSELITPMRQNGFDTMISMIQQCAKTTH